MTDRYIDFPPKSKQEGENIRADIKSEVSLAKSGVVLKPNKVTPDSNMVDRAFEKMKDKRKEVDKRGETVR